ncbi:hypothetical protein C8R44DRAFT_882158 [Mycena epipterygia]|nr:hypothetical protein C8R44DRAFT_882158 [Mycena epipterygia]
MAAISIFNEILLNTHIALCLVPLAAPPWLCALIRSTRVPINHPSFRMVGVRVAHIYVPLIGQALSFHRAATIPRSLTRPDPALIARCSLRTLRAAGVDTVYRYHALVPRACDTPPLLPNRAPALLQPERSLCALRAFTQPVDHALVPRTCDNPLLLPTRAPVLLQLERSPCVLRAAGVHMRPIDAAHSFPVSAAVLLAPPDSSATSTIARTFGTFTRSSSTLCSRSRSLGQLYVLAESEAACAVRPTHFLSMGTGAPTGCCITDNGCTTHTS